MSSLITNAEQITPDWLTHVLKRAHVLNTGIVIDAQFHVEDTYTAQVVPITVIY